MVSLFPCPCCGFSVHENPPGSHGVCPVCFWEDDAVQLRWPKFSGGANKNSLYDAQRKYVEIKASDHRFVDKVISDFSCQEKEPGWRLIDFSIDNFEESNRGGEWPVDSVSLYWWRDSFLRSYRDDC
ncbi:CPCC family cysteine-rich protein [Nocardiopsis sp. NPDC058631]|uniref:CPCC family cysteine-rich protein n=1 Tax=Nocardiopsis sp. NPDC058631 TaxID=3346566 RepID=UPI0036673BAD